MIKRREKGQALVEFAIAFPLQLLATLLILQVSFLYVAGHTVSYAAFAAARAELVGGSAENAAVAICTPIAGITDLGGGESLITYPGWGDLDRSDISRARTTVDIVMPLSADMDYVEVDVTCNVELIFPVANRIVSWVPLMPDEAYGETIPGVYHVAMTSTQRIPVPWRAP